MSTEGGDAVQEVIIVKKNVTGGGGHHGGAWKIAYADFMTAMMALFLVLWLVNASDEETKVHLASYFNPVKLRDTITGPKGVQELKAGKSGTETPSEEKSVNPKSEDKESKEQREGTLLQDPYKALDDLAAEAKSKRTASGDVERSGSGLQGADALGDVFDPVIWPEPIADLGQQETEDQNLVEQMLASAEHGLKETNGIQPETRSLPVGDPVAGKMASQGHVVETAATTPAKSNVKQRSETVSLNDTSITALSKAHYDALKKAEADEEKRKKEDEAKRQEARAKELKRDIQNALSDETQNVPQIEVEKTSEGLIVRLTDHIEFEMFSIASTQPKPDMVVFMEKIARVLAERPGQLVVMGHTDGRPFRSGKDNNWRLSAGRAQIAYHMLVRGGVDEKRFERIEGHADRQLKVPDDPESAKNRRIEILLVEPNA